MFVGLHWDLWYFIYSINSMKLLSEFRQLFDRVEFCQELLQYILHPYMLVTPSPVELWDEPVFFEAQTCTL